MGLKGDWISEGYVIESSSSTENLKIGHDFEILAISKSKKTVGRLLVYDLGYAITSSDVTVDKEHRRKGLASAMYDHAEKIFKKKMIPADEASDDPDNYSNDAKKFWSKRKR